MLLVVFSLGWGGILLLSVRWFRAAHIYWYVTSRCVLGVVHGRVHGGVRGVVGIAGLVQ